MKQNSFIPKSLILLLFWLFSVNIYAQTPPILNTPVAGATGLDRNFTIGISPVAGAVNYDIEISLSGLFNDVPPDYQGQLAGGRNFAVSNLQYGQTYTIRWKANNTAYGTATVTIKNAPPLPAAPALFSPTAGAVNMGVFFTISIGTATGAASYDIEISKNGLFNDVAPNYQGQLAGGRSFAVGNLEYNTVYTIRWRGNNTAYGSTTITTKAAPPLPAAPPLFSPTDGATNLNRNFTISIGTATAATSYDIEISKNGLFNDAFPDYQGQLAGGRNFSVTNLSYSQTYTIRWRGNNTAYGTATVTIKPIPNSYLSNIADGTYLDTLAMTFIPFYRATANNYEWQFDTTLSFNSPALITDITDNTVNNGAYDYDGNNFISGAKYYARLRVFYTTDTSDYSSGSEIISFYSALHLALIEAPFDGEIMNRNIMKLECFAVKNATDYELQFANNPSFTSAALYVPNLDFYDSNGDLYVKSYDNVAHLSFGTDYYLRARAYNVNQPSEYGPAITFNTGSPKMVVTSPANGATGVNLTHNITLNQFIYASIQQYKAEVSTDPGFASPLTFTSATRTIAVSGLAYSTQYYLRIQVQISGIWFISANPVTSYTTKPAPRMGVVDDNVSLSLVSPNPFVTDFKLNMDVNETVNIMITNSVGKVVAEYNGPVSNMNMGRELQEGIYVMTIVNSEGYKYVQRLVKIQN